jgi:hypothetical protein
VVLSDKTSVLAAGDSECCGTAAASGGRPTAISGRSKQRRSATGAPEERRGAAAGADAQAPEPGEGRVGLADELGADGARGSPFLPVSSFFCMVYLLALAADLCPSVAYDS